jgi:hypothetical protein
MYTKDTGGPADETGYDDRLGIRYGYDSDVPNHKQVTDGDVLVLRNDVGTLGVGFVVAIRSRDVEVETLRCPICNSKQLETPQRCVNGDSFESPRTSIERARVFAADYEGTFLDERAPVGGCDGALRRQGETKCDA